ncbi:MAG: hypothetical protein ACLVJ6_08210 [Merdibacter sp.]
MDGQAPSQEGLAVVKDGEVHGYPARLGESRRKAASRWKRIRGNDGDQLPQQGTLSRAEPSRSGGTIELNAENGYRQRVEFLNRADMCWMSRGGHGHLSDRWRQ